MAQHQQHVFGFSPNGKLFALINDQGVLQIWDTELNVLKQELVSNLHLVGHCTALLWITVETSGKKNKRGSINANNGEVDNTAYIVLGSSNGKVALYSYAQGKIDKELKGEGHAGKITAMVRNSAGQLFTCGEDYQVIVWSLEHERRIAAWPIGQEKPYSLGYLERTDYLVVGTRQINVFNTSTQELVQTYTGHTSEIAILNTLVIDKTDYILTTSRMERVISLWKFSKKERKNIAACTFLMEDIANCLSCRLDQEQGLLQVASVTRSGVIHIYKTDIKSLKADKPIKPKLTISIATNNTDIVEPISAMCVNLNFDEQFGDMFIGYGDKRILVFEHLTPNFNEKLQVLIRTDPKKLYSANGDGQKGLDTALKTLTPSVNPDEVEFKSSLVSRKKQKSSELPMEMRLQNLNVNGESTNRTPSAQSKVQLLVQALHSKDATLLRNVLMTDDMNTIQMTLERLPVQYVSTLVNELTLMMQQKRTNVEYAIKWLKTLTQTHSSQLLALGEDELLDKFGSCVAIIEHRSNCLKELSKFSGRLDLLVSHLKRDCGADQELNIENVLIYEDQDDSSNSEVEDNTEVVSESDGEWEENEDDMEDDNIENDENMETSN